MESSPVVLDQPHLIDTLRYRIQVQKIQRQEDIRFRVKVEILLRAEDIDMLVTERRIRQALHRVIPNEWIFAQVRRFANSAGYDTLSMFASTRASPKENYNLEERFRAEGGDGLSLTAPEVDYSLSATRLNDIVHGLRMTAIERAVEQAAEVARATGRAWRVGDIGFSDIQKYSIVPVTGKGAYRDTGEVEYEYEPGQFDIPNAPESEGGLLGVSGAERIYIYADVTLKAAAP
ncbi:MAG: hypothetical protein ACK5WE_03040 [bacterium]